MNDAGFEQTHGFEEQIVENAVTITFWSGNGACDAHGVLRELRSPSYESSTTSAIGAVALSSPRERIVWEWGGPSVR